MTEWTITQKHRASAMRKKKAAATYCIEGEYVNIDDVAARLGGISNQDASLALRAARSRSEPTTWSLLRELISGFGKRGKRNSG